MRLAEIKTLAVRCPNWVGDIVMATPVFDCLRANLPRARIVGVLKRNAWGIVADSPWFDGLVDGSDAWWADFRRMRGRLRAWSPDAAILLTNSWHSALTMRLSGVRKLYGYRREWRDVLLSGGPTPLRNGQGIVPTPMIEYYLEVCRWLGFRVPEQPRPRLYVGQELHQRGEALLRKYGVGENDLLVGLNPGASFGSSKCWPPEYFAEVADLCYGNLHAKIILFGGPGEDQILQAILDRTRAPVIDSRPDRIDLEMLKPMVKRCNLFITNDTGPRHYAVALDVPAVVITGPTDPRYTNANLERTVVLRREMDCSPCHLRVCPRGHECMKDIRPAEVFMAAERLLNACR
ncbi:MAG: lipopolysaccharide heptosyltransferase II [Sedimentisphaerales bacterium]|nr:lipopolysaccharide heptosyltransferase II [Sedimentisphaerales bacterium]